MKTDREDQLVVVVIDRDTILSDRQIRLNQIKNASVV